MPNIKINPPQVYIQYVFMFYNVCNIYMCFIIYVTGVYYHLHICVHMYYMCFYPNNFSYSKILGLLPVIWIQVTILPLIISYYFLKYFSPRYLLLTIKKSVKHSGLPFSCSRGSLKKMKINSLLAHLKWYFKK